MPRTRFNRHTFALIAILGTMWYAGAAQQNGSAYVLAFGAGSLALVSWLHARQHLKGLRIQAGTSPAVREGQSGSLPLSLSVAAGRLPTGLEISSPEATEPVFVERLSLERPTHVHLPIRPAVAGARESIPVVVRSSYPLGFFTTELMVDVAHAQRVHPAPSGSLPLPAPEWIPETRDASSTGQKGGRQGGDDFDGVRLWQQGDPLRHVDWKAVARGRPMMVKQFAGGSSPAVALDWTALDLPPAGRAGQLAKWIAEAEERGLRYSLTLPDQKLPADAGPQHRRRSLDALAEQLGATEAQTVAGQMKRQRAARAPTLETSTSIPGRPLALLCLAIALTMLPLLGQVPWTSALFFLSAMLLRWVRGSRPPLHGTLRVLMVLGGVAGIWAEMGSLQGLETGIGIMLCVIAGKALESRTARDLQVLGLLGWFLCLCCLVLQQDLTVTLYVTASSLLIAAALVRFRRGTEGVWQPLKTAGTLAVQALPLMLLLFVFFPRGTAGLVTSLTRSLRHQTGISGSLSPGSISQVAQSEDPAFRAVIHGRQPDPRELYWRCLTLSYCEGLSWEQTSGTSTRQTAKPQGEPIRQTIALEPTGDRWIPALDQPTKIIKGGRDHYLNMEDHTLRSHEAVRFLRRLEVESIAGGSTEPLPDPVMRRSLQLPPRVPDRVRALAEQLAKGKTSHEQIVEAALQHFAGEGFQYSLQPGAYGESPLEEFLFERKVGFCEHFAASFGTLMRLAGVPTRLVVGYQGGELFQPGDYYLVRQFNAHVWNEVWLEGKGWTRFDPTAVLAPTRLTPDFRSLLGETFDVGFSIPRDAWWGQAVLQVQMFWDNLNYQWFTRVVQFNEDEQFSFLAAWGLVRLGRIAMVASGLLVLILLGLWLWVRRPARHPDPAVRLWQRACRWLAKKGHPRAPNEGPLAYSERLSPTLPALRPLAELYVQHRYGATPLPLSQLRQAAAQLHKSLSQPTS